MGIALISTLLGACSTNRSTQNEQKTLNTEISKIVKIIQRVHMKKIQRKIPRK